jgi:hypothetical protein
LGDAAQQIRFVIEVVAELATRGGATGADLVETGPDGTPFSHHDSGCSVHSFEVIERIGPDPVDQSRDLRRGIGKW